MLKIHFKDNRHPPLWVVEKLYSIGSAADNNLVLGDEGIDALHARLISSENKVFLKDSVVVINIIRGDTLRTDELWWNQDTQQFYTDKAVRIHQPDKTIFGTGLKAAQDFSSYDIFNITGIVLTTGEGL